MQAAKLLHTLLRQSCPFIHAKRLHVLIDATKTLSECRRLSVSGIGRALKSRTTTKHNIKRIDRLIGNAFLQAESAVIYQTVSGWLVGQNKQPIILVDWSDLTADRQLLLLRAAIPVGGRSFTIYEEIHPLKNQASRVVHKRFLIKLAQLLPKNITPIIVTDAGFRSTWFHEVSLLGWHWVGRVRNRDYVFFPAAKLWIPCKTLYVKACCQAKCLGKALLTQRNELPVILHIVRRTKRGRVAKSKLGNPQRNSRCNKNANREREPWLIAVSPSLGSLASHQVMKIYGKRMQIEESFRDLKSERYGMAFNQSLTRSPHRLRILLLLSMLALFIIWLVGKCAIIQKIHHQFQSNTTKQRQVISAIFLGYEVIKQARYRFNKPQLLSALEQLQSQVNYGSLS